MTWAELLNLIHDYGFGREEYFNFSLSLPDDAVNADIWDENTRHIAVYWVLGSAEGYYVHVEAMGFGSAERWLRLLGKLWDWRSAQAAVNFIQYTVNMGRIPAGALPLGDETDAS